MRISAKAEYACVAMLELAANYTEPQPLPIKAIAEAQEIPQNFLVQILLQLKTAGLVVSVRGAAGGYQLARSPEAITLADVINAIDDRAAAPRSALTKGRRSPAVGVLLGIWQEVQAEEQRALQRVTVAELVRRIQEDHALSYQI
ncbi:MAG TPA: Rrf2 family transcriptional regulator [Gemmataceae bacterium]|nr:Rrf2 family transcriptional regulator [Gemmataceae bacterium]